MKASNTSTVGQGQNVFGAEQLVTARRRSRGRSGWLRLAASIGLFFTLVGSVDIFRVARAAGQVGSPLPTSVGVELLDGAFTARQASVGESTFKRVCTACHDVAEFSGGRFRLSWVGRSVGELFDAVSTLMPEGDPGSLSPDVYVSLVAYLLQLNGYPAGQSELPASVDTLRLIDIVAQE